MNHKQQNMNLEKIVLTKAWCVREIRKTIVSIKSKEMVKRRIVLGINN